MADKMTGFEAAMAELEDILGKLGGEGTTLEESVALYARAAELIKQCDESLRTAEVRIREIDESIGSLAVEDEE